MKTPSSLIPFALTAILTTMPTLAAAGRGTPPIQPVQAELDSEEANTLIFMREEERLARDVYLVMDELWQLLPFENIAQSEQRHMDSVKSAMDRYALTDPSDPNAAGIFNDQDLQQLYDDLIAHGDDSYLEALKVGALIEEVDIEDLENAIAETDNADLQTLYDNLLRGSRNHLRAFVWEIERQGLVYEAQVLDPAVLDAIVDSSMERGSTQGDNGKTNGKDRTTGSNRLGMRDAAFDIRLAGNGNSNGSRKRGGTGSCQG